MKPLIVERPAHIIMLYLGAYQRMIVLPIEGLLTKILLLFHSKPPVPFTAFLSFSVVCDTLINDLFAHFFTLTLDHPNKISTLFIFAGVIKTRLDMDSSYSTVDHHLPNYTYMDSKLRLSVTFIWSDDVSKTMVEQFRTW